MPFCGACGAPVEGRFCGKCGSTVVSGGAPAGTAAPVGAGMSENVASCLAYLFIPAIVFLLIEPYNKMRGVRFHAFQGIFLGLAIGVARWLLNWMLFAILPWSTYWGLSSLLSLATLVIIVYMMVMAYQGKKIVLPVIGPLAEQQA